MRIIVMFDLPVKTAKEIKEAAAYRNFLLNDGFVMMQYSIYSRICRNHDDYLKHANKVRLNTPKTGNVRMILVTERQYENMDIIYGVRKEEEKISKENLIIF